MLANKFPLVPSEGGKEFPLDLSGKKKIFLLPALGPLLPNYYFPKLRLKSLSGVMSEDVCKGRRTHLTNPQNFLFITTWFNNNTNEIKRPVLTIPPQIVNISWRALLASYSGVPFTPLSCSMTEHLYLLYLLASTNLTSHLETLFFKKKKLAVGTIVLPLEKISIHPLLNYGYCRTILNELSGIYEHYAITIYLIMVVFMLSFTSNTFKF